MCPVPAATEILLGIAVWSLALAGGSRQCLCGAELCPGCISHLLPPAAGWFSQEFPPPGGLGEVSRPSSSLRDPHKLLGLWIPPPTLLLLLQMECKE